MAIETPAQVRNRFTKEIGTAFANYDVDGMAMVRVAYPRSNGPLFPEEMRASDFEIRNEAAADLTVVGVFRPVDEPKERDFFDQPYGTQPGEEAFPCREYGHFDCASRGGGPCTAEAAALAMAAEEGGEYFTTPMRGPSGLSSQPIPIPDDPDCTGVTSIDDGVTRHSDPCPVHRLKEATR